MTIDEAIQKAMEGGWKPKGQKFSEEWLSYKVQVLKKIKFKERFFLDPQFWQCLGKYFKWDKPIWHCQHYNPKADEPNQKGCSSDFCSYAGWKDWQSLASDFFEYMMSGKSIESFFDELK